MRNKRFCSKMKKFYRQMVIEPLAVQLESGILTGSLTTTKIQVNTVEVEEFDAGFTPSLGYENDFQDLSFD